MSIRSGELPKGHFGELTAEELMDFGIWCEEGKLVWDENEVELLKLSMVGLSKRRRMQMARTNLKYTKRYTMRNRNENTKRM